MQAHHGQYMVGMGFNTNFLFFIESSLEHKDSLRPLKILVYNPDKLKSAFDKSEVTLFRVVSLG